MTGNGHLSREARIRAPSDFAAWRRTLPPEAGALALITGTFDLLQPGNWLALAVARASAARVGVILEADAVVASHSAAGRPQNDLPTRAEFVAHLRGVTAVTGLAAGTEEELLRALQPYVAVTVPPAQAHDRFAASLQRWAERTVFLDPAAGCFTEAVHAAMREGHTPLALPAAVTGRLPDLAEAGEPGHPAADGPLVTVNGCFDLLHIGHLRLLERARAMGGRLAVLINDDASVRRYKGAARPVFPAVFRAAALGALETVDAVYAFAEDDPLALLARLRPAIHVKGGSYEEARVRAESTLVAQWGGRVQCTPLEEGFSTSAYIRRALHLASVA